MKHLSTLLFAALSLVSCYKHQSQVRGFNIKFPSIQIDTLENQEGFILRDKSSNRIFYARCIGYGQLLDLQEVLTDPPQVLHASFSFEAFEELLHSPPRNQTPTNHEAP
jgi:hypothetical protein